MIRHAAMAAETLKTFRRDASGSELHLLDCLANDLAENVFDLNESDKTVFLRIAGVAR